MLLVTLLLMLQAFHQHSGIKHSRIQVRFHQPFLSGPVHMGWGGGACSPKQSLTGHSRTSLRSFDQQDDVYVLSDPSHMMFASDNIGLHVPTTSKA